MYCQLSQKRKNRIANNYNIIICKHSDENLEFNYAMFLKNNTEENKKIMALRFKVSIEKDVITVEKIDVNMIFTKQYKEHLYNLFLKYLLKKVNSLQEVHTLTINSIDPLIIEPLIENGFGIKTTYNIKEITYNGTYRVHTEV